jgi:uncharacterized cupredoxin-like copper-binding protein
MQLFLGSISRRSFAAMTLAGATALAAVACSGDPGASGQGGVPVTLRDFSVDVADTTPPAGSTRLAITNSGATVHELEVFTVPDGVDPNALPIVNNVADTDSVGMTVVDEVEEVAPSTTANLTVNLATGRYAFICNLPGHYGLGMHTLVTVE